jgi:Cu(I)/Ag(I) efflux system periplasmic protein CusF
MKPSLSIAMAVAVLLAAPALASNHVPAPKIEASTYTDGEVRKVDREAGKITIRHGPIANLDMPAMSMVFRVSDPALLERVKEGDKVRFRAEKVQGAYTLTEIQAAR